jgi:hypothetical protein
MARRVAVSAAALATLAALLLPRERAAVAEPEMARSDENAAPAAAIAAAAAPARARAAEATIEAEAVADARPGARATAERPARIRVIVQATEEALALGAPVPELLRLDDDGRVRPVAAAAVETAAPEAAAQGTRCAVFEVSEPGSYAGAWHAWLRVPGTKTWRVQRGQSPEIRIAAPGEEREIVMRVDAAQLRLDPALDAKVQVNGFHATPKDGE